MTSLFHIDRLMIMGLVAGALTTCSGMPQLYKSWKTRSTHDLSLVTLSMSNLGVFLWMIYGLGIRSLPVILSNGVGLTVLMWTLYLKIRYK